MTDDQALTYALQMPRIQVRVTANDYAYVGWLILAGPKLKGAIRCVVEDEHGRLFIHNPAQLTRLEDAFRKLPKLRDEGSR